MTGIKKFLDRRSEGLAKEKTKNNPPKGEENVGNNPNLTDDEFWAISNQFMKESRNSNKDQIAILQAILEQYTPLKIKQFAKRYEELNK